MNRFPIGLSLTLFGLAAACSSSTGPQGTEQEFVVEVTEIEVPESLAPNDTLHIRALGVLGHHGCFSLERVESVLSPATTSRDARLELTFIGRDSSSPEVLCLAINAGLDWSTLVMPPFDEPGFDVVVNQPDGQRLQVRIPVIP